MIHPLEAAACDPPGRHAPNIMMRQNPTPPRFRPAILLALAAVLTAGLPAAPARANAFTRYLLNRSLDGLDVLGFRVSGAKKARGAGIHVRATGLVQAGVVYFDGAHVGVDRRAAGVWRERRFQAALGPLAFTNLDMKTIAGNQFAHGVGPWTEAEERGIVRQDYNYDDGRKHFCAFGVEIQPGILPGFEARFHPIELLDFVVGFTTLDLFDDDMTKEMVEWREEPAPAPTDPADVEYDPAIFGELPSALPDEDSPMGRAERHSPAAMAPLPPPAPEGTPETPSLAPRRIELIEDPSLEAVPERGEVMEEEFPGLAPEIAPETVAPSGGLGQ